MAAVGFVTTRDRQNTPTTSYARYTGEQHWTNLFELILKNAAYANFGDAAGLQPSAADGNFYVSLHTASPGDDGDQSTNEVSYVDYARLEVNRSTTEPHLGLFRNSGIAGVYPVATLGETFAAFPMVGSPQSPFVVTHIGWGTESTGAGKLLAYTAFTRAVGAREGQVIELRREVTNDGSMLHVS